MPGREGQDEVILLSGMPAVVDALRIVLHSHPEYRGIRESADGTTFETDTDVPWSPIRMPLTITVITEQGQTRVRVAVPSKWWAQIDPYGSRDTAIRRFVEALREEVNARS